MPADPSKEAAKEPPQVPPPPMPAHLYGHKQRSDSKPNQSRSDSKSSQARREPSVERQNSKAKAEAPKWERPKAEPAAAPKAEPKPAPKAEPKAAPKAAPKAEPVPSGGPRAAASTNSHQNSSSADTPSQPKVSPARSTQKAANSAKFTGWSWGRNAANAASASTSSPSKSSPSSEPSAQAKPQRSQSSPPVGSKGSWFGGAGPAAAEKATQKKAKTLSDDMMNRLDKNKSKPMDERKKLFKDLQRELHPDKNIDQAEAAKQAFQKLMEEKDTFLAD